MAYKIYNLTNFTNQGNDTTILTFVEGVNSQMNAVPMLLMMIALYIILFLALTGKGFNPFKSFAATSFVMMIMAIIVYAMGLIEGPHMITFVMLCPLTIFLLWVFGTRTI